MTQQIDRNAEYAIGWNLYHDGMNRDQMRNEYQRQGWDEAKANQPYPNVSIYHHKSNGNSWHWRLRRHAADCMSSSEAFATAEEAEAVARSVATCYGAQYMADAQAYAAKEVAR